MLAQRLGDLELIVIDDASETPAADVLSPLRDERVRVVRRRRNGGIARARNSRLRLARAPHVSQLDADDLWEPDYLESVLPCFDDPGIGLAYTNATIIGHPDGLTEYIGDGSIHPRDHFPELAEANPAPCPTVTVRAEAMRSLGGYGGWLRAVEDWHLYMRLAAAGWRFAFVDRPLARYRWPRRERGLSFDSSRMERWSRLALADVAMRHPRTGAQEPALEAAAPGLRSRSPLKPRILIDPSSHHLLNLGDVGMLQVCVERLRDLWPGSRIGVVTDAPERLERHCPGVEPVPATGRYALLGPPEPRVIRRTPAQLMRPLLRLERARRGRRPPALAAYVDALLATDLFVMSGRGGMTDAFIDEI